MIKSVGRIHYNNAIACHIGQLGAHMKCHLTSLGRTRKENCRDGSRIESVGMTRRTRYTRASCCTCRTINAVQVYIVDHRITKVTSLHAKQALNHHDTRSKLVALNGTLEAVEAVGGIHYDHAVTRHVGQLRCHREGHHAIIHWTRKKLNRSGSTRIVSVRMSRVTRYTGCTRGSCGTRWAVNAVQVHIVNHIGGRIGCDLQHIHNHPDDHVTRSKIVGLHVTLKAIQRIGGIHHDHTVSRHVRQLGRDS